MMPETEPRTDSEYMANAINEKLAGAKISGAILNADKSSFGFRVVNHGKQYLVWVDCDAEGNGPGWLDIQ